MNEDFISKLRIARSRLEGGWMQGNYCEHLMGRPPCYCLMGALIVAGIHESGFQFVSAEGKPSAKFYNARDLIKWNDAEGRTVREVLACIDNSIAALEAEH